MTNTSLSPTIAVEDRLMSDECWIGGVLHFEDEYFPEQNLYRNYASNSVTNYLLSRYQCQPYSYHSCNLWPIHKMKGLYNEVLQRAKRMGFPHTIITNLLRIKTNKERKGKET